jgi:hypothetical protein
MSCGTIRTHCKDSFYLVFVSLLIQSIRHIHIPKKRQPEKLHAEAEGNTGSTFCLLGHKLYCKALCML